MYGNLMHQLFSRITTEKDMEPVLHNMQREGLIPEKERDALGAMIRRKLSDPTVKSWFSEVATRQVYTERAILCGDRTMIRPDRVIVEGDRITVVDFKFGENETPAYMHQVRTYMDQLSHMGYRQVDGFLWYVMLDKIVKI